MMIFLILAPFATFATMMLLTSATVSVFAGAAVAMATIAYDLQRAAARSRCSPPVR